MIRSKQDYLYYLKCDLEAHSAKQWKLQMIFTHPLLNYQRLMRRLEYITNCKSGFLNRIEKFYLKYQFRRHSIRYGFTMPINVFGPGLSIAHWGTIVVNGNAKIGARCRLHPNTCIGQGSDGKAPTIGDDAYIAPGAKIYGGITIGNNVTTGANSVVNKSFGNDLLLIGIPANGIKKNP